MDMESVVVSFTYQIIDIDISSPVKQGTHLTMSTHSLSHEHSTDGKKQTSTPQIYSNS